MVASCLLRRSAGMASSTRLSDERPDEVPDLHRRASHWYDQHGQPAPAVRHALAAGDIERAADLVELAIPALRRSRQEATIRGWLDVIPYELVRMRPVLAVGLVGGLMVGAETEGVEQRLRDAERWLQPATPDHPGSQALVLHIICAVIYAVLGGFQFSSALRRLRSGWYRAASGIT